VAARPLVTLRADLRQSEDPTQAVLDLIGAHKLEEAVVRLLIDLTPENEAHLNEGLIRDALRNADIYHLAGLRKDVEQPDRARLGGNPEGMTPEQLLERYFISREVDQARRGDLMEAARSVFDEVAGGAATSD
jgi:hypothetical protein